jgi:hypothetical protein
MVAMWSMRGPRSVVSVHWPPGRVSQFAASISTRQADLSPWIRVYFAPVFDRVLQLAHRTLVPAWVPATGNRWAWEGIENRVESVSYWFH